MHKQWEGGEQGDALVPLLFAVEPTLVSRGNIVRVTDGAFLCAS